MKFFVYIGSRIFVCMAVLIFLFLPCCFAEQIFDSENVKPDNYLLGMSVRKTFTGDYSVTLRFKNNTNNTYKLKELSNNSYVLLLPQVVSEISEYDINYENEHDGLMIVFSEKKDLVNPEVFSTQINFRTKDSAFLRIQALAESSDVPEDIKISDEISTPKKTSALSGVWYLLIGFVFACISIFLLVGRSRKKIRKLKQNKHKKVNLQKIQKTEADEKANEINSEENKTVRDESYEKKETMINQDLNLMPGVPELPFLDKTDKPKIVMKGKNFDLYNPENISEYSFDEGFFPDRMSIAERFKNRDLEKDINNLVFIERESYIEKLSSINDITLPVSHNDEISEQTARNNLQSQYDSLMIAFKNILNIAHNVFDDSVEPEVVDAFAVSDNVGFCLVKLGNKTSFVGNIGERVFLIRTFTPEELGNDTLFMEFCTETKNSQTYSVILNNFKALIRVTNTNISLIGDYTE